VLTARAGIVEHLAMFAQCSRMPYERVIPAPRHSVRLKEVLATDAIDAECLGSGRKWRIAPHRFHDRYPSYIRRQHIEKEVRCDNCGADTAMVWNVVRASPELQPYDALGAKPQPD
jgi:hypothetical protein